MKQVTVNAVGEQCPIPVVKATRALQNMREPGTLEVLVDNEIAVQNLRRMATGHHLTASAEKRAEKLWAVTIEVTAPIEAIGLNPEDYTCEVPAGTDGGLVVAVSSQTMGHGSDDLGRTLMKGFLFAVGQLPVLPKTILFYNGGAHLTCAGSDSLEDLKAMAEKGVEIRTCGTCLNFYGLTEQLEVGTVTNMYDIVETLAKAGKVIKP